MANNGAPEQSCHRCGCASAPHLATWAGGWGAITPGVLLAFCKPCYAEAMSGPGEAAAQATEGG